MITSLDALLKGNPVHWHWLVQYPLAHGCPNSHCSPGSSIPFPQTGTPIETDDLEDGIKGREEEEDAGGTIRGTHRQSAVQIAEPEQG